MIFLMFSANFLAYNPVPVLMLRPYKKASRGLSGSSGLYEIEGMSDKKNTYVFNVCNVFMDKGRCEAPLIFLDQE